jgi:hypothetical protein
LYDAQFVASSTVSHLLVKGMINGVQSPHIVSSFAAGNVLTLMMSCLGGDDVFFPSEIPFCNHEPCEKPGINHRDTLQGLISDMKCLCIAAGAIHDDNI